MMKFDYTNRDYASIREDLLSRASETIPEWTSREATDFGMVFVDLWAYLGDTLHYYLDRVAQEAFLETATQRSSVLALSSLLDYKAQGVNNSTAVIYLNPTDSVCTDENPVLIPKNTRFIGKSPYDNSDVVFLNQTPIAINVTGTTVPNYVTYEKSGGNIRVTLLEGETYTEAYTSANGSNQQIILNQPNVVAKSIAVTVNEGTNGSSVSYSQIERLIDATSTDLVYSTRITSDDYTILTFGNNANGKVPTTNSVITVTYRTSRGAEGNVSANTITDFESLDPSEGAGYDGIVIIPNSSKAVGGANPEGIEILRKNITSSFRSQDRAVSLTDYQDLSLRVSGVVKAKAVLNNVPAKQAKVTDVEGQGAGFIHLTTEEMHDLSVGDTIAVFNVGDNFDGTYVLESPTTGYDLYYYTTGMNGDPITSASVSDGYVRNGQVKIYALGNINDYDGTVSVDPTTGPLSLDTAVRDNIYEYLDPRSMVGVNMVVMPEVELDEVSIKFTLSVLPNYVRDAVEGDVAVAVKDLFTFDKVDFNQTITLGELYQTILAVDGVQYTTVQEFTTGVTDDVIDVVGSNPVVSGVRSGEATLLLLKNIEITSSGGITV